MNERPNRHALGFEAEAEAAVGATREVHGDLFGDALGEIGLDATAAFAQSAAPSSCSSIA